MAEIITVATYADPVQAELARTYLDSHGVWSAVIEGAAYNPMINAVVGITVQVNAQDAQRARALLKQLDRGEPEDEAAEEPPADDTVRCPRCELEYCFFENPRLRIGYGAPMGILVAVAALVFAVGEKRWRCHKCEHVWDDPAEGPKQLTRLAQDDPRPVFRLYRGHPGMGALVGLVAGALIGMLVMPDPVIPLLALFGLSIVGWFVGRALGVDVCSEPTCRAPLPAGAEECVSCKGSVGGRIQAAHEHYSAAADIRRELAAMRERRARKKKKRRKARAEGEDGSTAQPS